MTPFTCTACGSTVFFENDLCNRCGALQGWVPATRRMAAYAPGQATSDTDGLPTGWAPADGTQGAALRPCANRVAWNVCNWMLDAADPHALCVSCRLTRVIPSLAVPGNLQRWQRVEQAKRRLVFTLLDLGLRPEPKQGPEDALGLAFDLLDELPGGPPVSTGHDRGTVTVNLREADDAEREARRVRLGEPARTLLGHLRHETAHYLQYRWVDTSPDALARVRTVFGDERSDYAAALARHYAQGPQPGWEGQHVSAYASAHPWEDWAETCAHLLLVHDAVQTAAAWGLRLSGGPVLADPATQGQVGPEGDVHALVMTHWLPVAQFLNAMNRSIGLPDSYPYQLPPAVLDKMATVQDLLWRARAPSPETGPMVA